MKSMGVSQGYAIVTGLFEICKNTEIRLKFIKIDNSLHRKIIVGKNGRNLSNFMQNSAKKMSKNTIINIKQQRSKSHIFGFLPLQHCPPDTRSHSHIIYTTKRIG